MQAARTPANPTGPQGGALEVFLVALGLGVTCFGGPIAHLGYFERMYVGRRRWLSAGDYARLVALCQLLPGPTSSQVGFLVGLRRAGWAGGLSAWLGFTLPSALMMFAFARLAPLLTAPLAQAALHGLKLVAVAVVAQAVWSMGRKLCPDVQRVALALLAAVVPLAFGGTASQFGALAIGAVGGAMLCRTTGRVSAAPQRPVGPRPGSVALLGSVALMMFIALLAALPLAATGQPHSIASMAAVFYRAGALVFGGGHVILPLLHSTLVPTGWLSDSQFLAGYGAVQAMPGPLFTFAAYLGAAIAPHGAPLATVALWSTVAMVSAFLPGLLLAVAGMPLTNWVGTHPIATGALAGVNAAVVGLLAAALYTPISTSAILDRADFAIAVIGFLLLERCRVPPIVIVIFCVVAAICAIAV